MARWCVFLFGVIGLSWQVGGENNKYDNYTLMQIFPNTNEGLQNLSSFKDPKGEVEILKGSRGMNDSMDVLIPPARMGFVMEFMHNANATYAVKKENYGRSFEPLERSPRRRVMRPSSFNVFGYNSHAKMLEFTHTVASRHPDLVTLQDVGTSYEGRKMQLVKISSNPNAGNPVIFIDAGVHAREWVAPAMALYLIQRLTGDRESRQRDLAGVDWYILPVVNPDGYEYTRSNGNNRMWRKTRSKNGNCYGVDANRNYGFKWGVSGVSMNPCDKETYAGPKPFSEPETIIVRSIMMENASRMKLYVSLHSYGQYLVYPWGYTGHALPKEWQKLHTMAKRVSDAVQSAGGQPFKVLSAGKWYPAAGGSDDYAFGAIGVPYSYTMELTDGHEFIYPEHLLKQVLPQLYNGFKEFGDNIRREFGRSTRISYSSINESTESKRDTHSSNRLKIAYPPLLEK